MAMVPVKHEVYGRGKVDADSLATTDPLITFYIDTPRDIVREITEYVVGKAALDNSGGYVPRKRSLATRIEMYLPLVSKAVSMLKRPQDDWDELYAVGSVALVKADAKFNHNSNFAFASYAKPYIMGYIKNHINPERNGTMNQLPLVQGFDIPVESNDRYDDIWRAFYQAMDHMTAKQRQVMKLLYIEGHTLQNVADIMGIERQPAERLRDRAVVHVRKKLGS
jgi:RNA polymerase sigma factor (sigma-70 family)